MNTQQAIRVACVGAGYFSRFHYESWSRMPGAFPIASCNRDINKAKETGLAAYDDLSKMLEVEKPDLLDIILPTCGAGRCHPKGTALWNKVADLPKTFLHVIRRS